MTTKKKPLSVGDKHLLRLCRQDMNFEGWTPVSNMVLPLIRKLPEELVEIKIEETGAFVRLTHVGNIVVDWIL